MIARGEEIPEVDRDAQFPEGIRTRRELTLVMERAAGWSYRLLPSALRPDDFFRFALLWVAVVSSLTIPALYVLALRLSRSHVAAFAAAAAYGVSWVSACNGIRSFVHESFALPLIAASFACLAGALDAREKRARLYAAGSALALAAALSSWHFTRFYLASLVLAGLWTAWRLRKDAQSVIGLRLGAAAVAAGAAAAWALDPVFRGNSGAGEAAAYGHVWALLFEKLRHGLAKPLDPRLLSQEARLLWLGAFNSPKPQFAFYALFPMILIAAPRAWGHWRKEKAPESAAGSLTDGMLLLYAVGALMVSRLLPMFAFFLCAAASRFPERLARKRLVLAGFALLAGAEALKSVAPASPLNPFMALSAAFARTDNELMTSVGSERQAVAWLRMNGGRKPVLANFGLSPTFLEYADSPILLQSKFEAASTRAKTTEFLGALYSDEAAFLAFCRKHGAAWFVYTPDDILDTTGDGPRYIAGGPRLTNDTAAVRFQFRPDSLKHFRLAFENDGYRVYAVGEAPRPRGAARTPPIYDLERYAPETLADGTLRLDTETALTRMRQRREKLRLARLLERLGRRDAALKAYEEAVAAWPDGPRPYLGR
ncbi:MAG: hypothetical protein M0D55_08370 [Elusimicrobiota bacterium]|nr:MAG: hypothetical protein M0D55_08370 [Elusimicrobiota bacterium]